VCRSYQKINVLKIFLILTLILLDIAIKQIIFHSINLNEFLVITPFFDLAHIHNFGVSFGLLSGIFSHWILIVIALFMTLFVIFLFFKSKNNLEKWGLILIIAGALSNILDRFINGYVIDFLYFHYKDFYWPAFNFADIYITIGIIIIILQILRDLNNRVNK
jgi:signal peptidase II